VALVVSVKIRKNVHGQVAIRVMSVCPLNLVVVIQELEYCLPPCRLLGATQTQPQLRFHLRVRRLQRQLLLVETQEQPVMLTAVPGQQAPIGRLESGHQMIQNVVLNVVELIGVNTMVVVEDGVAQEIV